MFYFYVIAVGFSLWMAFEAIRRDQQSPWLWVMAIFWPVGAVVYFFSQYLRSVKPGKLPNFDLKKRVSSIN